jgi:hypothetical protein
MQLQNAESTYIQAALPMNDSIVIHLHRPFLFRSNGVRRDAATLLQPDVPLDMSRPYLWKLQRTFADQFLRWLPLNGHETTSMHLNSAHIAQHSSSTILTYLVLLMYLICSIAADGSVYTISPRDLPGFGYSKRAHTLLRNHSCPNKDLVTLRSQVLVAVYLLYAMRPLEAWKSISQTSQDCMVLLRTNLERLTPEDRASFGRIY